MNNESGIKIEDKRRFTPEGEVRPSPAPDDAGPSETEPDSPKTEVKTEAPTDRPAEKELPPINFATFILSLASSVQIHLGLVKSPVSAKVEKDLILARQTIDILSVLQEKTKGNLDETEKTLLEHLLYDLRLRYVEVAK